ncbi:MAG: amino acid adenylation domain-containing protein, partial [Candidatus Polarisedimenticolia bacterium]
FRELLGRVRETTLGAFAHQELPFERLVEDLQPARDLGRNPIFQVLLELQNAPSQLTGLTGLSIDTVPSDSGSSRFDLEVQLCEEPGGGLDGFLVYNADLFDPPTAQRLAERYVSLLASVAEDPSCRLSRLALLEEAELDLVVRRWNDTTRPYPHEATIAQLFAEVASRHPDGTALLFEGGSTTYGELLERAHRAAGFLRARGVRPESRVAIAMERSPEMVTAILGVLCAGGAYVPVDLESPPARTARMLADAGVTLAITDGRSQPPHGAFDVVAFDEILAGGEKFQGLSAGAGNLAYVMFTSGSTGEPKGIEVTQRNVVRLVRGTTYAHFGPDETILHLAPGAFDASTFEIWGALLSGGRLAIAPAGSPSPGDIARLLERHDVTTVWLTAGLFHLMVDEELEALSRVPQVLAGGDVISPSHVRRLMAAGCRRFVNGYGPTETTTFACCGLIDPGEELGERMPIGAPVANSRAYVLDEAMQPVPVGVTGELFIGGDGVSRGYARRPGMTATQFLPDPFGPPGARLYRTGDLVRWRGDGRLEFLGRRDGQVKVRGFRVEVAEVEAALAAVPGVRAAAVITRREHGEAELVGYVVADGGHDAPSLREALAGRLPRPMIPARFVMLEALPLTANGKIDRRALPAPAAPSADPSAAPRTQTEREVAGAWAEVLRLESVGLADNFFDLGGHSLLATQVVSRLRARLGVEVPLRSLFESPTVEAIARLIDRDTGLRERAGMISRRLDTGPAPLSFAQQRLWFLDTLAPGSVAYNIPNVLRLEGSLDVTALERTLSEILRRHEAIRTRFVETPHGVRQSVEAPARMRLDVVDLALEPDAEATARRLVAEEAMAPFDLSAGPQLRARLVRLAPDDHLFLMTIHHIVSDGWSMGVLVRELVVLYEAYAAGHGSPLEELPIQYADFAVWQRDRLQGERLERELAYWKERLTPLPAALELP